MEILLPEPSTYLQYVEQVGTEVEQVHSKVLSNIDKAQEKQKEAYKKRKSGQGDKFNFQEGQLVLLYNARKRGQKGKSLDKKWLLPPRKIIKLEGKTALLEGMTGMVNVQNLKLVPEGLKKEDFEKETNPSVMKKKEMFEQESSRTTQTKDLGGASGTADKTYQKVKQVDHAGPFVNLAFAKNTSQASPLATGSAASSTSDASPTARTETLVNDGQQRNHVSQFANVAESRRTKRTKDLGSASGTADKTYQKEKQVDHAGLFVNLAFAKNTSQASSLATGSAASSTSDASPTARTETQVNDGQQRNHVSQFANVAFSTNFPSPHASASATERMQDWEDGFFADTDQVTQLADQVSGHSNFHELEDIEIVEDGACTTVIRSIDGPSEEQSMPDPADVTNSVFINADDSKLLFISSINFL